MFYFLGTSILMTLTGQLWMVFHPFPTCNLTFELSNLTFDLNLIQVIHFPTHNKGKL